MGFLKHFRGLSLKNGGIYVHQTGATIPINGSLLKDGFALTKFNSYIIGLRLWRYLRRMPSAGTLAFYPQQPGPWYNAWLMARIAGLKITKDINTADHVFIFDDSTHSDIGATLDPHIEAKAINPRVSDISKTHVANVFADVFGYGLKIDPLTYEGPAVQKSDANGTHDGIIIHCPIKTKDMRDDCAYQKLIDSTFNGSQGEDLRLIFVLGEMPVIFHKWKDLDKRFGTDYAHVDIKTPEDVLSFDEQNLILKFCQKMGLDFGAIDVMRDKHDGQIYIVDVNKTGMPVLCLTISDQAEAFIRIAKTFLKTARLKNTLAQKQNDLNTCNELTKKIKKHST